MAGCVFKTIRKIKFSRKVLTMKKIFYYLSALLLIIACLLGSVFARALDSDFYVQQYEKNNTMQATGMSIEDLQRASDALLDYMMDETDTIEVTALVNGHERLVFDERETMHMVDVKVLFLNALTAFYACAIVSIIIIAAMLIVDRLNGLLLLSKAFGRMLIIFVCIITILGVFFYFNFNVFWTLFHMVLFTNDLWILDASISIMINMFPLNFFFDMCVSILVTFASSLAIIFALLFAGKKVAKKRLNKLN